MNYKQLTELDIDIQRRLLVKYKALFNTLPDYNMTCKTSRSKKYYYLINPKTSAQRYIKKSEHTLIENIKTRHFLETAIKILESNIKRQDKLCKLYQPYDYTSINSLLPPVYKLDCNLSDPANTNSKLPHRTSFGMYVRSKSEALIAEVLHSENIAFRYELPLQLKKGSNHVLIHPDFTIMGYEPIYWEHMGMMSNNEYRSKALSKLELYCSNGITIPDKLIVTMDTADGTIDMLTVKRIIETLPAISIR